MPGREGLTKSRILDACEQLYAAEGFEALTLRAITDRAQVNLASVNYHFQSKEMLTVEMLKRHLALLHADRLSLLGVVESALQDRLRPTHVLSAVLLPMIETLTEPDLPPHRVAFALRCASDPATIVRDAMERSFKPIGDRLDAAFVASATHMASWDVIWRTRVFFNAFPGTVSNQNLLVMMIEMLKEPDISVFHLLMRFGSVFECIMHQHENKEELAGLVYEALDTLAPTPTYALVRNRIPIYPETRVASPFPV